MRVDPTHWGPPSCERLLWWCSARIKSQKIKGNKLVNFVSQCHLPEFERGEKRLHQSMKMLIFNIRTGFLFKNSYPDPSWIKLMGHLNKVWIVWINSSYIYYYYYFLPYQSLYTTFHTIQSFPITLYYYKTLFSNLPNSTPKHIFKRI
jgi:hypothetical protein